MITLNQIDQMFPEEHRGSVYSDLHKDAYGYRPRESACVFESLEDFELSWDQAQVDLRANEEQERHREDQALDDFKKRIEEVRAFCPFATIADAIGYVLDAQGITKDDVAHYGYDYADYKFGLKYGSVANILKEG